MFKQLSPFKYDSVSRQWIKETPNNLGKQELKVSESFKLGSLNIMDEKFKIIRSLIVRDDERFKHTIKLLEEEDFDVLALNEVTPRFLKRLQESTFFSEKYFFSDIVNDDITDTIYHSLGNGLQGNLILSKVCPHAIHLIENPISKHFVLATFETSKSCEKLCIVSAHTLAYAKNIEQRRAELKSISSNQYIKEMDQVIILGDLNLHAESEDEIIETIGYTDIWKETRNDKGFTFDPKINSFIRFKYLGMENRRMRLDRILIRNSQTLGACQRMELFANKPIHEISKHLEREPLKTPLWYTFFNSIFGNMTRKDYLFFSDHFGMKVHLKKYETYQQLLDNHQRIKNESREELLTENVSQNDEHPIARSFFLFGLLLVSISIILFKWL